MTAYRDHLGAAKVRAGSVCWLQMGQNASAGFTHGSCSSFTFYRMCEKRPGWQQG